MDENKNNYGGYEYKPEPPKENNQQGYTNYNNLGNNQGYQAPNNTQNQQTSWTYGNSVSTTPLTPPTPPKAPKPPKPPKQKGNAVGLKVFSVVISAMLLVSVVMLGINMTNDIKNDSDNNSTSSQQANEDKSGDSGVNIDVKDTPSNDSASIGADGRLSNQAVFKKASPSVVGVVVYAKSGGTHQVYGQGSGVILSTDGYIVTNAHVILSEDPSIPISKIEVVLADGEYYPATVIGSDKKTDIGVLKIDAPNLVAAEFGDSDKLEVGEDVFVIGNPDGLQFANSLTGGIVSALNREVVTETTGKPVKYIQTNATINPGNSGGALVNQYGQVVGIPVAKIVKEGYEGLGFAIPFNDAKPIVESIIKNGYVAGRPKIGISYTALPESYSQINGLPRGLRVVEVTQGYDAYEKGLQAGDIITHMDGVAMIDSAALASVIDNKKPNDTIKLTVFRVNRTGATETLDIEIILGEEKPEK